MGMAASQARFLGLTARKNNNEYQAQQINQQRLNLAEEQEDFTNKYNDALSNTMMYFFADGYYEGDYSTAPELTYWNIVNPATWDIDASDDAVSRGLGYRIVDANGNVIVPNYPGTNTVTSTGETIGEIIEKYNVTEEVNNDTILQNNIKNGEWIMRAKRTDDEGNEYWEEIPYEEADFIIEMRGVNPDDDTDKEYWRLYNTLAPKINGQYQELTFKNLLSIDGLTIRLYDKNDKILTDEIPEGDMMIAYGQYHVDAKCIDSKYLADKLRDGEWFIQRPTTNSALSDYETTPWQGIPNIYEGYDTTDDAAAEAEYEAQLAKFQKEDKLLEMRLKQLETEHKALETEMDSVSKVLEDNVTKSFKTFSA